ncbi:MAG: response regulator [Thermodesulfobacteriota bacterium]
MKILVVEGNETLRRFFAELMRAWQIEVDFLKNYAEVEAHIVKSGNHKTYISILLEITDMHSSSKILKKLKGINPDLKVIACCNSPYEEIIYEFEQHGYDGVLSKPFQISDLKTALGIF